MFTKSGQFRTSQRQIRTFEPLEDRRVLSTIVWDNRVVGDNFAAYGANTAVARQIVDRAIDDWERVIVNFNYANGTNTFHMDITADTGACGSSSTATVDPLGKPTSSNIEMHPSGCGGNPWYFDPLIGTGALPDDSEFDEFITPFAARRPGNDNRIDFYTAVLHEIGHSIGIGTGHPDLKINDYLSGPLIDDPVNPSVPGNPGNNLYSVNVGGGPIEATFTDAGSGSVNNLFAAHLYEGPATLATALLGLPIHPQEVVNDGRTWSSDRQVRRLISDFTADLLSDIYGYTVSMPSNINTFYANTNLATGQLVIQGDPGAADDLITVNEVANDIRAQVNGTAERITAAFVNVITIDSGTGNDLINVDQTPVGIPTDVFAGSGDDIINVANGTGNLTFVDGDVNVFGGLGNDILNIQDLGHSSDQTYYVSPTSVTPVGLGYSINYNTTLETIFLNGDQGNSIFNIDGTLFTATTHIHGQGGDDSFNAGGISLFASLDQIDGTLTMNGGDGQDEVRFNDTAHIGSETYTLTQVNLQRTDVPNPIAYSSMESVLLDAGGGNDTIDIDRTNVPTVADGNGGSDTFRVGNGDIDTNITSDLSIIGGVVLGPNDHLIFDDEFDTNNDNYFLTDTTFNKFNFIGSLTYDSSLDLVTLIANPQNNNIFVDAVAAGVHMTINGMGGNDRIFVGDGDIDTNIDGDVTANGGFGDDELILSDSLDQAGNDTYTLTATTFDKTSYAGSLDYNFINQVTLNANQFDNVIDIDGTSVDAPITVNGNDGADTFNVNAPPSSLINVHGGNPGASPGDSMTVTGTASSDGMYMPSPVTPGEGVVNVDGVDIVFTGLEPILANLFSAFTLITPNSNDNLVIREEVIGQNVIRGTSGGVAFEELVFFDIGKFVVDMSSHDNAVSVDQLLLNAGNMPATGVNLLVVDAGTGANSLTATAGITNVNTSSGVLLGRNLDVTVRGTATRVNFLESQTLQSLTIITGLVSLEPNATNTVLWTTKLDLAGGPSPLGTLDLHDNGVILDYNDALATPYPLIRNQIIHARNENAPATLVGVWNH